MGSELSLLPAVAQSQRRKPGWLIWLAVVVVVTLGAGRRGDGGAELGHTAAQRM